MKRRNFVKTSGLAVAGVTTTAALSGFNILNNPNRTVNIAVIGTGDRGSGLIPFLNEIEGIRVSACCDTLPFRLENGLKKVNGNAKGYKDYRGVLDDKNIDAILVAVPFSEHAKIEMDALDAGKHIYGEKTLVKGYSAIKELLHKKNQHKELIFQTGHQYHSSRLYTEVVQMIKNGKIGNITAFESQWNRNGNWRRPVPDPSLEKLINWRMYREYSGGLTAELCSHQIDFANWVLEEHPKEVVGLGGINYWKDGRETYDNIHLIYNYPSGVKATFQCLTSNAKDDYQIKVMGDKGTIILGYTNAWFYPEGNPNKEVGDVDGVSGATLQWEDGKGIPIHISHNDPSKQALMDFRDSILNGSEPISNLKTGAGAAICVQMGLDAMYSKTKADWSPEYSEWLG
ncbi:Gfo/Idh/MocA family protein [Robertkochia solimangrovi]|uniref:Gfo/Idh/MocA family protein n=1 Tax=Robertkochia solimangrovi TaxID=2213046 RepID=UPI001180EF77|nr:Gfo/Idh/MocA family oxidoreductase [Robertkochia solimangrovi]TRZ42218.1 gfo/Idh/MocA family oxidoreductase [Robertkochia solimangrovi]